VKEAGKRRGNREGAEQKQGCSLCSIGMAAALVSYLQKEVTGNLII